MTAAGQVFSIGHSNHSPDVFLKLLQDFRIKVLFDVRSSPYSRYMPRYNRQDLQHLLSTQEVAYDFAGESLGGRPKDPWLYKAGVLPEGKADYLHMVNYPAVAATSSFRNGLRRLMTSAQERTTVMMCSEEDPQQCHRHHLIAGELHKHGFEVLHIRKSGRAELFDPKTSIEVIDATLPRQAILL